MLNDFYLAGGTAVVLHLGQGISCDLDFFSRKSFDGLLLKQIISDLGDYKVTLANENNLIGLFNGTKLSFIHYMPELIGNPVLFDGVKIASIIDLMAMKIEAISQRGAKRDFIDLFFIMKKYNMSLIEIMLHYTRKYKDFSPNIVHTLKSLIYFEDAEKDIMPEMMIQIQWKEIREYFSGMKQEIIQYLNRIAMEKIRDTEPEL